MTSSFSIAIVVLKLCLTDHTVFHMEIDETSRGKLEQMITEQVINIMSAHLDRVTHICVSNLAIIGSDHRMLPGRRQAII